MLQKNFCRGIDEEFPSQELEVMVSMVECGVVPKQVGLELYRWLVWWRSLLDVCHTISGVVASNCRILLVHVSKDMWIWQSIHGV